MSETPWGTKVFVNGVKFDYAQRIEVVADVNAHGGPITHVKINATPIPLKLRAAFAAAQIELHVEVYEEILRLAIGSQATLEAFCRIQHPAITDQTRAEIRRAGEQLREQELLLKHFHNA